jgi:hypothetical protein
MDLVRVFAPLTTLRALFMIELIVNAKFSNYGLAPFADHMFFGMAKVILLGVLRWKVPLAWFAIVMSRRMDQMILVMLVQPKVTSARFAFYARHGEQACYESLT